MKVFLKILVILFIFQSALTFISCGKYEDGPGFSLRTKKARLTGEWEVVEIDGDNVKDGDVLEFFRDGTFEFDYGSGDAEGEWEWEDGKSVIELDYDDAGKYEFEILRLTNKELWVENESHIEVYFEKD